MLTKTIVRSKPFILQLLQKHSAFMPKELRTSRPGKEWVSGLRPDIGKKLLPRLVPKLALPGK